MDAQRVGQGAPDAVDAIDQMRLDAGAHVMEEDEVGHVVQIEAGAVPLRRQNQHANDPFFLNKIFDINKTRSA